MKKILLANIGNRNFLYQGKTYYELLKDGDIHDDFRSFTEHLWQQYDQIHTELTINILQVILEAKKEEIEKVILFVSDHPTDTRRDQDTLFAGKILARLIPKHYPEIIVQIHSIQVQITDPNQLLLAYRNFFRQQITAEPERQYLICDAGGTAQQKSSLKIICEYLLDREDFEVYYVAQGKDYQSELRLIPPVEYRKILDAEQIIGLIERGEYRGAVDIYSRMNRHASESPVFQLLQFGRYRSERLWMEAQRYADPGQYPEALRPNLHSLSAYRKLEAAGNHTGWAAELFPARSYFEICECFAILQREYELEHYTETVLNMFRFMEAYLYHVLDETFGYHFRQDYQGAQHALLRDIPHRFPGIRRFFGKKKKIRGGLPILILAASHIHGLKHDTHEKMIHSFQSFNSLLNKEFKTNSHLLPLDMLRHQIAHRGLGVTRQEFLSIPHIDGVLLAWGRWLQMPLTNPYRHLNQLIENCLTTQ